MLLAQFLLPGVAVGYPDIGLMAAQHLLGDIAFPAWGDLVQDRVLREEDPLPMSNAVGARGRLIRRDDPSRQQLVDNRLGGSRHMRKRACHECHILT